MSFFKWLLSSDITNTEIETESAATPEVNVDGSPMVNNIDINGNTYGVTESSSISVFDNDLSSHSIDTSSHDPFGSSSFGSGFDDNF